MCPDIRFENLRCVVKRRKEEKSILNSVNGYFRSGKLTGILGSSGAGKTTLLNILAGYSTAGVTGEIYVDGTKRDAADLKRISTYLPQDILIQPFLTVQESLNITAELKLGTNDEVKTNILNGVTKTLGLTECLFTRTEHLSGGQRKRLSIALELMSNPSVIFLDEPTT
ncbi:ABC transporter ATP-binding protein, partial [Oryctes borbonicus]